jgi:hypothetical protein
MATTTTTLDMPTRRIGLPPASSSEGSLQCAGRDICAFLFPHPRVRLCRGYIHPYIHTCMHASIPNPKPHTKRDEGLHSLISGMQLHLFPHGWMGKGLIGYVWRSLRRNGQSGGDGALSHRKCFSVFRGGVCTLWDHIPDSMCSCKQCACDPGVFLPSWDAFLSWSNDGQ